MANTPLAEAATAEAATDEGGAAETKDPAFRIGGVLSRSFSVLFRNIIPFGLTTVLMMLPFGVGLLAFLFFVAANWQSEPSSIPTGLITGIALLGLSFVVSYSLVTAALVYGSVQEMRGQRAGFGACIGRGLARVPSVLGVIIVSWLAILAAGVVMFIPFVFVIMSPLQGALPLLLPVMVVLIFAPVIILFCMFWLAVPVAVIERPGIFASLKRSIQLTKGHRWRIFAVTLVLWLLAAISELLFELAGTDLEGGGAVTLGVASGAVDLLLIAVGAVATAVGYYTIRTVKEGVDIEEIAKVFD